MKYSPVSLSLKEMKEIASFRELQEWHKTPAEMLRILKTSPSAKFVLNEGVAEATDMKEIFAPLPEAPYEYAPAYKIARNKFDQLLILE